MYLASEQTRAKVTFDEKFGSAQKFAKMFKEMAMEMDEGEEPKALIVATTLFEEMKEFNAKFIPIVEFLGIEAIKEEHWAELLLNANFMELPEDNRKYLEYILLPEDAQAELDKPEITRSAISIISGDENENDATIILKHVENLNVSANINFIEELSIKAQKQFKIEMDIRKIKKNLKENELVIEKYKVSSEGVQF
jgi:hypothetical protein